MTLVLYLRSEVREREVEKAGVPMGYTKIMSGGVRGTLVGTLSTPALSSVALRGVAVGSGCVGRRVVHSWS